LCRVANVVANLLGRVADRRSDLLPICYPASECVFAEWAVALLVWCRGRYAGCLIPHHSKAYLINFEADCDVLFLIVHLQAQEKSDFLTNQQF
jgi:hypothetical protein